MVQSDRHKRAPRSIRLPDDTEEWLREYSGATGEPVNAIIVRAVQNLKDVQMQNASSPAQVELQNAEDTEAAHT